MPKGVKKEETVEDRLNRLEEELVLAKKSEEKALEALAKKEVKEKKEKDPMSGPGELCQVTHITMSESLQVPSREVINPDTQTVETKPDMSKVPEGHTVRPGPTNSMFIVKQGDEDRKKHPHDIDVIIPICQSKYTRELTIFTKKAVADRGNFKKKPPRVSLHLCEKHEKMFGAKLHKDLPADEKSNINKVTA